MRFDGTRQEPKKTMDYGGLILGETVVEPSEALSMIESLLAHSMVKEPFLVYPGKYEFKMHESHAKRLPVHSYDRYLGIQWPATVGYVTSPSQHVTEPVGPLVSLEHPLYTDARRAIIEWVGLDAMAVSELSNGLAIILPDFRLRIRRTMLSEGSAVVSIEGEKEVLAKAAFKAGLGYGKDYVIPEVSRKRGDTHVDLPRGIPSTFDLFVLHEKTGEVLDWQEVYTSWTELPRNFEFSIPGQQITRLVEGGERDTVEVKANLGSGDEFIESVISFANTGEGVILVGVDDNAVIVGVASPEKETKRIVDMVNDTIEPIPKTRIEQISVEGKEEFLVNVQKGENPPYLHKIRLVGFIRRAGTDRLMGRVEFDETYGGRSGIR